MALRPFKSIQVAGDRFLSMIQQNVGDVVNVLTALPILDGNAVAVTFPATAVTGATPTRYDVLIPHGLGRVPSNYLVGGKTGPGDIYTSPDNANTQKNNSPRTTMLLSSSTPGISAGLWFY